MNLAAESLKEPGDLVDTLTRIACTAKDMVPRADYASVSVYRRHQGMETVASTDPMISLIDELQRTLGEGPCYGLGRFDDVTYSGNIALDVRWPTYGTQVARLGIASEMSLTLHADHDERTQLNLYSRRRAAFGDSRRIAGIFVSHAKVALGYAQEVDTLRAADDTRAVVGEAIGIVMKQNNLLEERAFELLIRVSQNNKVKLRSIAAEIVETKGQLA